MKEENLTRREFSRSLLASAALFAFLETITAACGVKGFSSSNTTQAIAPKAAEEVRHWAVRLQEMSLDLENARIAAIEWQAQVERLFSRIELAELLKFIDFARLRKEMSLPDLGVATRPVAFPSLADLPGKTVFVKKIFGMKRGRAIVPHGHSNMASAHLVLNGSFHLRNYEKLSDEGDRLIVEPTVDKTVEPGDASSISDERDNVHWFIADSDEAYTFDVIVLDLGAKGYEIHNLDIDRAERLGSGKLRVPKIDVRTALRKYGKQHHQAKDR